MTEYPPFIFFGVKPIIGVEHLLEDVLGKENFTRLRVNPPRSEGPCFVARPYDVGKIREVVRDVGFNNYCLVDRLKRVFEWNNGVSTQIGVLKEWRPGLRPFPEVWFQIGEVIWSLSLQVPEETRVGAQ